MARELGFFENNTDIIESKNISQKIAAELKNVALTKPLAFCC